MDNLRRLGDQIYVSFPSDEAGFTGRHCPQDSCGNYFKIQFGTGLKGSNLPCHCPYCGYKGDHSEFHTQEQIEYAKSVAIRKISDAIYKDFKKFEFNVKPHGGFGIGLSLKVKRDRVPLIRYYHEKELETIVVCSECGLRYAIYGVFAYCPDCAAHNSLQILNKNLDLLEKQLELAHREGGELGRQLIEDALENAVSTFDAFGRQLCSLHANQSVDPGAVQSVSFQNLEKAKGKLINWFRLDLTVLTGFSNWTFLVRCFQKRHLLAHKLGVIDQVYIENTDDPAAIIGRKVSIEIDEVKSALLLLKELGKSLSNTLSAEH